MGNSVFLKRTEFKDASGVSKGYRAFDDYDKTYNNMFEELGLPCPEDDLEFLQVVLENFFRDDEKLAEMLRFAYLEKEGIYINDEWYGFEENKKFKKLMKKYCG